MTIQQGRLNRTIVLSCLVFLVCIVAFCANGPAMFNDPDTGWHLATGDLIRSLGALPAHDPWSFTAGDAPWVIMSWAWDVGLSYFYQHFGWHGVIAINAIIIAASVSTVFAACFTRSRDATMSMLAVVLVAIAMNLSIRPHEVTFLLTAWLSLLLMQVFGGHWPRRSLLAIPPIMLVWVNVHGGFVFGFIIIGVYGLNAIAHKNRPLTLWLLAMGGASLAACCINPYGPDYLLQVGRLLLFGGAAKPFITEWAPLNFSMSMLNLSLYVGIFVVVVMMRPLKVPPWEKHLSYIWLYLGVTSIRNMPVFEIVTAPMLSVGLYDVLVLKHASPPVLLPFVERAQQQLSRIANARSTTMIALAACLTASLWLFTPQARVLIAIDSNALLPDLSQEITFLETYYPHARLMNYYSFGGPLVFYTRGKIPVFVDGREISAFPEQVVKDYFAFGSGNQDSDDMFEHYGIDGVIFPNIDAIKDRFGQRRGWHLAFTGKTAMIFMRDNVE
jgi:hypothetical protein